MGFKWDFTCRWRDDKINFGQMWGRLCVCVFSMPFLKIIKICFEKERLYGNAKRATFQTLPSFGS